MFFRNVVDYYRMHSVLSFQNHVRNGFARIVYAVNRRNLHLLNIQLPAYFYLFILLFCSYK